MSIISPEEIQDLREEIAPKSDESIVEVWRMQAATVRISGAAGTDKFGMPLEDGARPDQKSVKVSEYPCRISRAGTGNEREFGEQITSVIPWTVTFNWDDNPDIRGADRLVQVVTRETEDGGERAAWQASTAQVVGDLIQPTQSNGRFYRCTVAGTTGSVEPTWPTKTKGALITDGSVTWEYVDYLRTLEVKDPGGDTTYKVVRLVRCEEIKWGNK